MTKLCLQIIEEHFFTQYERPSVCQRLGYIIHAQEYKFLTLYRIMQAYNIRTKHCSHTTKIKTKAAEI